MIYTLHHDLPTTPVRRGDKHYDAEMIYFDGWEDAGFENPEIDYTDKVPPIIEFIGNLEVLERSDFPYVAPTRLVMSRKMLNVLLSVQLFKHQVFPVRIYSYGIEELVKDYMGERTDYQVEEPSLYTDKFVIMQLTETTNVIDINKTIVEGKPACESEIWYLSEYDVEHYEFTKEEKDLPPVFAAPNTPYFFTEAVVRALEANDIRGVEFHPIPRKAITTS
jgi:hypothetical protein